MRLRLFKAHDVSGEARDDNGRWTGRAKYADGRLVPVPGDAVFMAYAGFMGMPTSVAGEVYASRGGNRVKITKTGPATVAPKTMPLDDRWSVVGDPELVRRRNERDGALEAQQRRIKDEARAEAEALAAARARYKPVTSVKRGDVLENLQYGHRIVVHSGTSEDDAEATDVDQHPVEAHRGTIGLLANYRKLSPDEVKALPPEHQANIAMVKTGKAQAVIDAEIARVQAAEAAEATERERQAREETNIGSFMAGAKAATIGTVAMDGARYPLRVQVDQRDAYSRATYQPAVFIDKKWVKLPVYLTSKDTLQQMARDIQKELPHLTPALNVLGLAAPSASARPTPAAKVSESPAKSVAKAPASPPAKPGAAGQAFDAPTKRKLGTKPAAQADDADPYGLAKLPRRRKLSSVDAIGDFDAGRDKVVRFGDRTFVVDRRKEHAPVEILHDALTPESRQKLHDLAFHHVPMAIQATRTTPKLSEEGRAERLAVLEERLRLGKSSWSQRKKILDKRKAEGMDPREYCQSCGAVFERGEDGRCNTCRGPYDAQAKEPLAKDMEGEEEDAPEEGMDDMGGSDMLKSAAAAWFAAYPPPTRW